MWSVWDHEKDTFQQQEVTSVDLGSGPGSSLRTEGEDQPRPSLCKSWLRPSESGWVPGQPADPPVTASEDVTDNHVGLLSGHSGTGPTRGEVLLFSISEKLPWGLWFRDRPALSREGGSPALALVSRPDESCWRLLTLPPTIRQQQTLCWALLSLPACELPVGVSSPETGWGGPGLSQIKPVPIPCSCPFCDCFQWNSSEDQQWANYHARHWGWSS